jgi:phosphoribosylformimino-5-aminoimidazole carboxamide ribotide isomerase
VRLVPVIDLKGGRAVHARGGDRRLYRPVTSRLGGDAPRTIDDPAHLAALYDRLLHPEILYVADLDRIAGSGDNDATLGAVCDAAPGTRVLWDGGFTGTEASWTSAGPTPVLASETLHDPAGLSAASTCRPWVGIDLVADGLRAASPTVRALGEIGLLDRAVAAGVEGAVVVLIDGIGKGSGLPLARLGRLRRAAPKIPMVAGGGIATLDDLAALRDAGYDGALVATALHDGRLTPAALRDGRFV